MVDLFRERPVQLISVVESREGKQSLQLCPDGLEILKAFDFCTGPRKQLHIVSVLAGARTGKSTLLNFLLAACGVDVGRDKCFIARPGGRSVTSGIWFWGTPLLLPCEVKESKEEKLENYLMLLDCQGIGLGDDSINMQLTSLTCMFSSLVILNIDGFLNEEHKTLLGMLKNFLQKMTGTHQERTNFFPTLLVRSRDYRKMDLYEDLKISSQEMSPELLSAFDRGNIFAPELREELCSLLDEKLNSSLAGKLPVEIVDSLLAKVQKEICASFPSLSWFTTFAPDDDEENFLDENVVLPLGDALAGHEEKESKEEKKFTPTPFVISMQALLERIFQLVPPKTFGSAKIDLSVLVSHFENFLTLIQEERSKFHIPTMVEALMWQQVTNICERAKQVYDEYWSGVVTPQADEKEGKTIENIETSEELKLHQANATTATMEFYEREIKERNLLPTQVSQGREKLTVMIQTWFLVHQEKFREAMYNKLLLLKQQAERDHKRQLELDEKLILLQQTITGISAQISDFQAKLALAEKQLTEAHISKRRAEEELLAAKRSASSGGGGGFCSVM